MIHDGAVTKVALETMRLATGSHLIEFELNILAVQVPACFYETATPLRSLQVRCSIHGVTTMYWLCAPRNNPIHPLPTRAESPC